MLQQSARSVTQRDGVEFAVRLADFESSGFARLEIIEDAVIDIFERWADNFGEAITVFADNVDTGFHAHSLRLGQQASGFCSEFGIRLIERVEQQQVP